MASKEAAAIRRFVREELSGAPDLSELTIGILRKRYLIRAKCDSLSPEVKQKFKKVVEEELLRMQDNDKGESESKTQEPQNKRKREVQSEEVSCESGDEVKVKKSRPNHSSSSSEAEDKEVSEAESEEDKDEEQNESGSDKKKRDPLKSQPKENGRRKEMSSKDSSDEEKNDSDEGQTVSPKKESKKSSDGEGSVGDADAKSEKGNANCESSDDSDNEGKKAAEKKSNDSDSDSSQSSLDDDKPVKREEKTTTAKKKGAKKEGRQPSKGEKSVNRLKHYIALCGVRKNYKKLFEGCKSVSSQLNILRKELEELGVHGNPSIKKCKKAKKKQERAQELAGLDVNNIITTKGRPRRGGAWQKQADSQPSTYQRAMNSGSDSDQEDNGTRRRRRVTEWANLRGIISDDADSD